MEFLGNFFRRTTRPEKWVIIVAALALLWLTAYVVMFFCQVNSTLSDATWGDVAYYNQLAYNFTHGRPLQSSLYLHGGPAVLYNPFPYVHSFTIHVNFTPYIFLWLYKFMPTVNGLYLITILFNIIGFLGVGWLIERGIFPDKGRFVFYALTCAVLFCAMPFADVITYKGHFALFGGPLILLAYYFCLRDKRLLLAATGLLLCGISEDMAMFMCSFSAYLFIFEKQVRKTALWMGIASAIYLAFAFLVIQPASETGLTLAYSSDVVARLHMHASGTFGRFRGSTAAALYFIRLVAALIIMALFSGFGKRMGWKKPLGLIILAPASCWFVIINEGPGHHLIPVLACTFLAFLLIASKLELRQVAVWRIVAAVLIGIMVFLPKAYRLGRRYPFYIDAKSTTRIETNKTILNAIAALPKEAEISYWTNQGTDAFITSRNSAWRFPDYFDLADYLVIQKDADQTFFSANAEEPGSLEAAFKKGQYYTSGTEIAVPAGMVKRIEHELVEVRASHEVKTDTKHVLILKRKVKAGFPSPESTIGLNWIKYIRLGRQNVIMP